MGNYLNRFQDKLISKLIVRVFNVTCENQENVTAFVKELENINAPRCCVYVDDYEDGTEIVTKYLLCMDENIDIDNFCIKYKCNKYGSIHKMTVDQSKYNNHHQIDHNYFGKGMDYDPYILEKIKISK